MEYLTLGELRRALVVYDDNEELNVELTGDWGSYRGYYDQLYIGYKKKGDKHSTVDKLRGIIEEALDTGVMHGYKGGEFSINEHTEVCFAQDYRATGGLYIKRVTEDFDGLKIVVEEEEW